MFCSLVVVQKDVADCYCLSTMGVRLHALTCSFTFIEQKLSTGRRQYANRAHQMLRVVSARKCWGLTFLQDTRQLPSMAVRPFMLPSEQASCKWFDWGATWWVTGRQAFSSGQLLSGALESRQLQSTLWAIANLVSQVVKAPRRWYVAKRKD